MRTRLTALIIPTLALLPALAVAGECQPPPLSAEQLAYLQAQQLVINVPEGDVADIQRCDIDGDNTVDINDIRAISAARNQPAAHPDDPMDWDRNNYIDLLDARGCQLACTLPRCATQQDEPEQLVGGTTEAADCYQVDDFNGDGETDVVTMSENLEGTRGGNWTLEVVILTKDATGAPTHVTFPYTGKKDQNEIQQHLSEQPAGDVNLNPGMITTDKPAIVSYADGEPKVIYYYDANGNLARAFYGIDD